MQNPCLYVRVLVDAQLNKLVAYGTCGDDVLKKGRHTRHIKNGEYIHASTGDRGTGTDLEKHCAASKESAQLRPLSQGVAPVRYRRKEMSCFTFFEGSEHPWLTADLCSRQYTW